MILHGRNADNSIHIGKFRLCKSAKKNCSEAGSYYSCLAYAVPSTKMLTSRRYCAIICRQNQFGTEKYPRGRRGSPAKGVVRVNRSQGSNPCFSAIEGLVRTLGQDLLILFGLCYISSASKIPLSGVGFSMPDRNNTNQVRRRRFPPEPRHSPCQYERVLAAATSLLSQKSAGAELLAPQSKRFSDDFARAERRQ